jgi:hypothetical protein
MTMTIVSVCDERRCTYQQTRQGRAKPNLLGQTALTLDLISIITVHEQVVAKGALGTEGLRAPGDAARESDVILSLPWSAREERRTDS